MPKYVTKCEIKTSFSPSCSKLSWDVVVPKGTEVRGCMDRTGQFFVEDLSFIDKKTSPLLYHDALYYGIRINKEDVECI